jgi:hypothetical protein
MSAIPENWLNIVQIFMAFYTELPDPEQATQNILV